jgi:hypothetical protein
MNTKARIAVAAAVVTLVIAIGAALRTSPVAAQQSSATTPVFTPKSPAVAAGETDAKRLLILMDADKSGTVSRKEFMDFMAAEFDRLDTNKDGVLDVKELEQSQLVEARRGGTRR